MNDRPKQVIPLSELLASVDTPEGRRRTLAYLDSLPYPHFRGVPGKRHLLKRIEEDGTVSFGRFVDRKWVEVKIRGKSDKPA